MIEKPTVETENQVLRVWQKLDLINNQLARAEWAEEEKQVAEPAIPRSNQTSWASSAAAEERVVR